MRVLKFGGTSMGSAVAMKQCATIIKNKIEAGENTIVVVSAISGVTNLLIDAAKKAAAKDESYKTVYDIILKKHTDIVAELAIESELPITYQNTFQELTDLLHGMYALGETSPKLMDKVMSFGERLSSVLFAACMHAISVDARDIIVTNNAFNNAVFNAEKTYPKIQKYFSGKTELHIVTGFIGATENGETTTLGRGGSDLTAAIIGAALNATEIEIWTDVDGMMTSDPRRVPQAYSIESMSFIEALEMSHFGAKVIYPPTLIPAIQKGIPIRILNTFNPAFSGTKISANVTSSDAPIKGITCIDAIALINLVGSGMVGVPGTASRLFSTLAKADINVILITQASSEQTITFAVHPHQAADAVQLLEKEFSEEIKQGLIEHVECISNLSVIAVIGENMRHTRGIAGKMFHALGINGVNITAIAQGSSEYNISAVVDTAQLNKALHVLHDVFLLSGTNTLNVFMAGTGLIGKTLMQQIKKNNHSLQTRENLHINIAGLSNSKKQLLDKKGVSIDAWNGLVSEEKTHTIEQFIQDIITLNLPNAVFVDCTSNANVVAQYARLIENHISIVTPNKLANSGTQEAYNALKKLAKKMDVKFLYETNVGAGLPVITTLQDLIKSGDEIIAIEGVLSGTLSYIFNNFKSGVSFYDTVLEAKEKGYTEPDPRDDLNCKDVARKLLILCREAGIELESSDIEITPFLPDACFAAPNVDAFFEELKKSEYLLTNLVQEAENSESVLRCIAKLQNGKASIALEKVSKTHPFYSLSGSDNMIVFTTSRYKERPLVIKGPGAGAEVTAAGVFAEIIKLNDFYFSRK